MADMKPVPPLPVKHYSIDLTGGMNCDAETLDQPIHETVNLIKPAGGVPRGLRVRGGITYFDRIVPSDYFGGHGVCPTLNRLNTANGYPGNAFITTLINTGTGAVQELHSHIEQRGQGAPDEEDLPSLLVPLGVAWAGDTIGSDGKSDGALKVNVVLVWDPTAELFGYVLFESYSSAATPGGEGEPSHGGYVELSDGNTMVFIASSVGTGGYELYNWKRTIQIGGSLKDLVAPIDLEDIVPQARMLTKVSITGNVFGFGSGYEWISRGGMLYTIVTTQNIGRSNATTGEYYGLKTVAYVIPPGYTYSSGISCSRPDPNGYVVFTYLIVDNATSAVFKIQFAKVNPATGVVATTIDGSAAMQGATTTQVEIRAVLVIPLESGGYFVSGVKNSTGKRLWCLLNSGFTTCTVILNARTIGTSPLTFPLINCGGINNAVYSIRPDGSDYRLVMITDLNTTPAVAESSVTLSADALVNTTFISNESIWAIGVQHFRMSDNRMMWGMWSIVDLTTGEETTAYPVEDQYDMQTLVNEVPGGPDFPGVAMQVCLNPDPFKILRNSEGYLEVAH